MGKRCSRGEGGNGRKRGEARQAVGVREAGRDGKRDDRHMRDREAGREGKEVRAEMG